MNVVGTCETFQDVPMSETKSSKLAGSAPRSRVLRLVAVLALVMCMAVASAGPASAWLHRGSTTQYPSTGGRWEYGFWDAKVRSYYTVSRCHGSTVYFNDAMHRSANTASGYRSIAELWAYDAPWNDDRYYYRVC